MPKVLAECKKDIDIHLYLQIAEPGNGIITKGNEALVINTTNTKTGE